MRRLVLLIVPLPLAAASCGGGISDAGGTDTGGGVSAVAAVYPLAWMAEQVAPEAEVTSLSAGGLEAHDLELTPGQRQALQSSDVVLYVGDIGYQPQVEEAVPSAEGEVVSLAEVAGPDRLVEPAEAAHGEEGEGGEEGGGGSDASGEHGDDEGAVVDAHIWFDPEVMADAAVRTGEAFATADPQNADTYRENADALGEGLRALGGDLDETLGGECRHDEAIVSHQAYGYLLAPYGVDQHGVTGLNPEAGASSAELAELVSEIQRDGIEHVLAEPVEGRAGAETVAREAGVELLEISPLDAVTDEQAEQGFLELVRGQAQQFATALGC